MRFHLFILNWWYPKASLDHLQHKSENLQVVAQQNDDYHKLWQISRNLIFGSISKRAFVMYVKRDTPLCLNY